MVTWTMNDNDKLQETLKKDLDVRASEETLAHMRNTVLDAHGPSQEAKSALMLTIARRKIMRNPIAKFAVAAAVVAAALIGATLFRSSGSGVAWAEVARKVEANQGFTYQMTFKAIRPDRPDEICYIMTSDAGARVRLDWRLQPEGQLFRSQYYDFDAETLVVVNHNSKTWLRVPINERTQHSLEGGWRNAKDWVRQLLSAEHTKLGRRIIEGVPCEGIETTDPTFGGIADPPPASLMARLWVNVDTGYPFRLEYHSQTGDLQVEAVLDQFRWDVELDPSELEPTMPEDYTLEEWPS